MKESVFHFANAVYAEVIQGLAVLCAGLRGLRKQSEKMKNKFARTIHRFFAGLSMPDKYCNYVFL
ncbi:hypothetical protein KCP69_14660 [Salmonella enterica subsp. enterica]|nr:hypothetical protein KCP69_14660 [Salmonella enterica subsp. enterica]